MKRQLIMTQESEVSRERRGLWMAVHGKLLKTAEGTEDENFFTMPWSCESLFAPTKALEILRQNQ